MTLYYGIYKRSDDPNIEDQFITRLLIKRVAQKYLDSLNKKADNPRRYYIQEIFD